MDSETVSRPAGPDPRSLGELPTPALLLDLEVLERNLERTARRARELGVGLRPHFKTHKCLEVARRQHRLGARGMTVSTLEEARALAGAGFDDLTWALPVILGRIPEARELAGRVSLGLVVDSPEAVAALEEAAFPFRVWLKVDCGYHRAGVDPASPRAVELVRALAGSERLVFAGLLAHSGQAYAGERARAAEEERRGLTGLAERLRGEGLPVPAVSAGSTPGFAAARSLAGVTEVRPGNYAFHDFTQVALGTCGVADCALTVLASVVSCQPGAAHAVVDAGALALSRDPGPEPPPDEALTYGRIYADYPCAHLHPDLHLTSLSQELGKVSGLLPVGSRVRILPNHSCLAAPLFDVYWVVRGEEVVDRWPVRRER